MTELGDVVPVESIMMRVFVLFKWFMWAYDSNLTLFLSHRGQYLSPFLVMDDGCTVRYVHDNR